MKWMLLWVAISPAGGLTSGSAPFETDKACFAAQQAMGGLWFEAERGGRANPRESTCVNTETGEKRSAIKSRTEAEADLRRWQEGQRGAGR
ncbi:hypothetical protein [Methylobacterium aquaticum]|uniref:hypothetical protein n=1 Tax=Methylobacterium aquaticum TaxID=270351 RepID=UPI001933EE71|nr:hypothetical protein [Methylobacterium aquaticum]QRE77342.1 hypothetical protein F1D61_30870 [Methylobacterium aquaticum]